MKIGVCFLNMFGIIYNILTLYFLLLEGYELYFAPEREDELEGFWRLTIPILAIALINVIALF